MITVSVSNYLIVGSGLSAFICFLKKTNTKVLTDISGDEISKIEKSHNFYECNKIGGNTNIWGGYIDICRGDEGGNGQPFCQEEVVFILPTMSIILYS